MKRKTLFFAIALVAALQVSWVVYTQTQKHALKAVAHLARRVF